MKKVLAVLSILGVLGVQTPKAEAGLIVTGIGAGVVACGNRLCLPPAGWAMIGIGSGVTAAGAVMTGVGFGTLNPIVGFIGVALLAANGEQALESSMLLEATQKLVPEVKDDPETIRDLSILIAEHIVQVSEGNKEANQLLVKIPAQQTLDALELSNLTQEVKHNIAKRLN